MYDALITFMPWGLFWCQTLPLGVCVAVSQAELPFLKGIEVGASLGPNMKSEKYRKSKLTFDILCFREVARSSSRLNVAKSHQSGQCPASETQVLPMSEASTAIAECEKAAKQVQEVR